MIPHILWQLAKLDDRVLFALLQDGQVRASRRRGGHGRSRAEADASEVDRVGDEGAKLFGHRVVQLDLLLGALAHRRSACFLKPLAVVLMSKAELFDELRDRMEQVFDLGEVVILCEVAGDHLHVVPETCDVELRLLHLLRVRFEVLLDQAIQLVVLLPRALHLAPDDLEAIEFDFQVGKLLLQLVGAPRVDERLHGRELFRQLIERRLVCLRPLGEPMHKGELGVGGAEDFFELLGQLLEFDGFGVAALRARVQCVAK
mmetsp:Transcript_1411/g.3990  ORF Transcript_1411/g.3990 Transcript_1411/m.3990 type:complete len:259 (+) Transcript_1411:1704-2480(+)